MPIQEPIPKIASWAGGDVREERTTERSRGPGVDHEREQRAQPSALATPRRSLARRARDAAPNRTPKTGISQTMPTTQRARPARPPG